MRILTTLYSTVFRMRILGAALRSKVFKMRTLATLRPNSVKNAYRGSPCSTVFRAYRDNFEFSSLQSANCGNPPLNGLQSIAATNLCWTIFRIHPVATLCSTVFHPSGCLRMVTTLLSTASTMSVTGSRFCLSVLICSCWYKMWISFKVKIFFFSEGTDCHRFGRVSAANHTKNHRCFFFNCFRN